MTTPPRLPGDRSHLERLLDRWAREHPDGVAAIRLRRLIGVTAIIAMLDGLRDDDGNEQIGFKGGSALELRFGLRARASGDLDAAYRGALDDALDRTGAALQAGWSGFTGRLVRDQEITRAGVEPPPRRVQVKLDYKGRPFVTIPFEIAAAEGRSLESIEIIRPAVSLAPVQLPGLDAVPCLPLPYQIAQKLHACTEDVAGEIANQRVHDLHDLLLIEQLAVTEEDLPAIKAACVEIFDGRAKHPWPPKVTIWSDWPTLWRRLAEDEGFDMSLEEACAEVEVFIAAIDAA
jgi:hypothetical protein